ncbi:hypothetical protein DWX95_09730 [Butyricicoccus sp. AF22-28AC]|nr:hypothetical protein [Butyricicoccus sp. AF22-28AC]RHQ81434.1 hypothetical protein DWX95_09730 [Butyricicoccus sp. AF22-28AC]
MHNIKKRLVSAFLLFAMALSFYPAAFAANGSQIDTGSSSTVTSKVDNASGEDDSTPTNKKKDIGNLFLCARPTLGNSSPQGWQYASFFTWIMRTTGSEQLIPAESAKDIEVYGFFKTEKNGISNDYEVRLKYDTDKDGLTDAPVVAKADGGIKYHVPIDQNMKDSVVYYIQAQLYDKDLKRVIDTKMLTVTVQITHKKQNSVGYHRVGMQVYDIDGVPFGHMIILHLRPSMSRTLRAL